MKKIILSLGLLLTLLCGGCATQQLTASVSPGTDLKKVAKIHVERLPADSRGVDQLFADRLKQMGKAATAGTRTEAPADADAILTYQDKWVWDITMYMLELNVQLRHPKTNISLATAHSLRTSLVRKSPAEMVEEVLKEMFSKQAPQ